MFDFYEEIKRFKKEMDRMFKEFDNLNKKFETLKFSKDMLREPLVDLIESDNKLIANVELPGVNKDDIQLKVTEDNIEIKVERKHEARIQKENFFRAERSYKGFYKMISLPVKIIPEKTTASYKDGILEITMEKAESEKIKKERKVQIK